MIATTRPLRAAPPSFPRSGRTRPVLRLLVFTALLGTSPALADDEPAAPGFWERDTLTGTWGGLRTDLEEHGVTVAATYTAEALGNAAGGLRRRAVASGLLQVDVEADLDKLVGWSGGLFHASGLHTHGRQLSANFLGNMIPVRDIETAPATRLFALWLQQSFLEDRVSIRAGQVPMQEEFFNSIYAANLISSPFGWPGSFAANMTDGGGGYPLANLGARLKVQATDHLTLLGAVFTGDPAPGASWTRPSDRAGDPTRRNRSGTDFTLEQPPVWFGEAQYTMGDAKDPESLPTTLKVGGWYTHAAYQDLRVDENGVALATQDGLVAQRHYGNGAIYGIIDQMLWRAPGSEDGGLGMFLRATAMPDDRNQMPWYVDTGLALKGTFEGRENDVAAIGFAFGKVSDHLIARDDDARRINGSSVASRDFEALVELSYRYQVTPWWTLVPDAQYVFHPGGGAALDGGNTSSERIPDAVVLGLRTVLTL